MIFGLTVEAPDTEASKVLYSWLDGLHTRAAKAVGVEDIGQVRAQITRDEREVGGRWTQLTLRKFGDGIIEANVSIGEVDEKNGSMSGSDTLIRLNPQGEYMQPTSTYDAARIAVGAATVQKEAEVNLDGFGHLV